MRSLPLAAVLTLGLAVPASAVVQQARPIPTSGPAPSVASYVGKPAVAQPFPDARPAWANPFMAPNPANGVHNDSWQSDAYTQFSGPMGRAPEAFSSEFGRTCITLTFDRKGRLEATCTNLTDGPGLYLFDPVSLDILAFRQLPFVPPPAGTNPATNTTGGAYFFLDDHDRAVIATSDRRITVIGTNDSGAEPVFEEVAAYDPTPCLDPEDRMPSALPDAKGRYWFVGRAHGSVGVLDPKTGKCGFVVLGEEIENSFAIGSDGAYVVTDKSLYKLRAGADLMPRVTWSKVYGNIGVQKPGQFNAGSGTTPTLIAGFGKKASRRVAPAYVAITDNADPMRVVVYRAGDGKVVCQVPVFAKGAGDTENSIISMGRSLFVENNYGYDIQKFNDVIANNVAIGGDRSLVSSPGFARIDIARNGRSCRRAWENDTVRAPSVVPKGVTRTGVIYTFENVADPQTPDADPWYWTALSARTGKVLWKKLAGWGGQYNNHYAGIALGRHPVSKATTLYVGGVGGIMALRDGG
ncbi:MAG: hypothetical protein ACJ762_12205 [Solirubrobacteraceae bacterium]